MVLNPWLTLIRTSIAVHDEAGALAAIAAAQAKIDQTGALVYQPFLHEIRTAYARNYASPWQPEEEIREAHRLFILMGAEGHAERLA